MESLPIAIKILPYLIWFAIAIGLFALVIGFFGAIAMGLGTGMLLICLHALVRVLPKFNENADRAHVNFEKLNTAMQEKLLAQVRMSETWKRDRKEKLEDVENENGREFPDYQQTWRKQG